MKRGQEIAGGKFVGISKGGIVWVSYAGADDFRKMCETFDKTQK